MYACHACQAQLLEYLYDLLDEADRQALAAHLGGCPACQAALVRAQAQQRLLAAAARLEFPAVRFTPPTAEAPPVPPAPRTVLLPTRPRLRPAGQARALRRWAVAAGLLVAVGLLGLAGWHHDRQYAQARQVIQEQETVVADAREQVTRAEEDLRAAAARRDERLDAIRQEVKQRALRLVVTGPRSVQPGAPATFQARTYDLNNQPAA